MSARADTISFSNALRCAGFMSAPERARIRLPREHWRWSPALRALRARDGGPGRLRPGLCDRCDYCTVSDAVVECETVPLVPVIVSENVPRWEFRAVVTLRTDEPEPATLAGANDEVAFLGNPVTLSATDPVNPFKDPTVTVYVVDPPRGTVAEV